DIRKRAPTRHTLTQMEESTTGSRLATRKQNEKFSRDLKEQQEKAQEAFDKQLAEIDKRTDLPEAEKEVIRVRTLIRARQKLDREMQSLERENQKLVDSTQRKLEQDIRS